MMSDDPFGLVYGIAYDMVPIPKELTDRQENCARVLKEMLDAGYVLECVLNTPGKIGARFDVKRQSRAVPWEFTTISRSNTLRQCCRDVLGDQMREAQYGDG
jgi:hypothetical protein